MAESKDLRQVLWSGADVLIRMMVKIWKGIMRLQKDIVPLSHRKIGER